MANSSTQFDLIGVGAPIMDLLARVDETFLTQARGEKGGMVMVDDAEMARLLSLLPGPPAHATGGSAANATFNATRLGLRTTFLGKLGNDELASVYRRVYRENGVDVARFKAGTIATGRSLILTTPDAARTMRTNLGAVGTFAPAEVSAADFAGCRHAHIEGYVVFNQALADQILASARAAGCTISMDLASFEVVNAARPWILGQLRKGIDIVFANEDEIRALFPDEKSGYEVLAQKLATLGVLAAVKVGKEGAWIAHGAQLHRIAPVPVANVIDTNGAGDAWAAGFLYGHLSGWTLPACGALASLIGAETVMHMGPLIPKADFLVLKPKALALRSV